MIWLQSAIFREYLNTKNHKFIIPLWVKNRPRYHFKVIKMFNF